MTDRELLEAAAKAAGLNIGFSEGEPHPGRPYVWKDHGRWSAWWNPLEDDGDALRLLNKLELQLRHVHGQAHAGLPGEFWCTEAWFQNGDRDAAARRATTRAAAAIGGKA